MEVNEVDALFMLLQTAGLKPPCNIDNPEERKKLANEFYERYKNLDGKAVYYLADKMTQLPRWATYEDVDKLLEEFRVKSNAERQYANSKEARVIARNNFLMKCLGRPIGLNENWLMAMAEKSAKKYFPDADKDLVNLNKQVLAQQCENDYICLGCTGKSVRECPTGGRRPFLQIDPDSGLMNESVDWELCDKVVRLIVEDDEEEAETYKHGNRRY